MFEKITPEAAGISSAAVEKFISRCEKRGIVFHSVLMMRGDKIFTEYYWKPFTPDFLHRMYSETKSYVSVAIGLLEEEGKLSIDDKIVSYFDDKFERELPENMREQTVREMLTMTTCCNPKNWFYEKNQPDRVRLYFDGRMEKLSGGFFEYDSPGSQVLCALAERLSGKPLFDYLDEKIFRHLGTFRTARILKTPNGDSWGDSALLCTTRDMASFARFVMNYGTWNGKRLMNENYLRLATTKQVSNRRSNFEQNISYGYGYQMWMTEQGGFSFHGMGGQFTVCLPDKDFIFVCTGDNQGYDNFGQVLFSYLFDEIVEALGDKPLPEDTAAFDSLEAYGNSRELAAMKGEVTSPIAEKINGVRYVCTYNTNAAGIKSFSFNFYDDKPCELHYTNAQGEKTIYFGMAENAFFKFPQLGYSSEVGGIDSTDGYLYDAAASAIWDDDRRLFLNVQLIDKYFGNFYAVFAFKDDRVSIAMAKHAEAFLDEYCGEAAAIREDKLK